MNLRLSVLGLLSALLPVASSGCSPEAAQLLDDDPALASAPTVDHSKASAPDLDLVDLTERVVEAINALRRQHDVPALTVDPKLARMALSHSTDMATHDFFDHVNPRGEPVRRRADAHGVACSVGENLFQTYRYGSYQTFYDGETVDVVYAWKTAQEIATDAVTAWLQSPLHRMVLLRPEFSLLGIGIAPSSDLRLFITHDSC